MTNEEATANYKYDRAIDLIRCIKTEETHEREINSLIDEQRKEDGKNG